MTDLTQPTSRHHWIAIALVILLAIGTSIHAYLASATKSPTFDEPVHMASAWLIVNKGDFRLNPEHPPLWKYLAGMPLIGTPMQIDLTSEPATKSLQILERQWWWISQVFSTTSNGVSPIDLLQRSRAAMSVLPCALILLVAWWAWAWRGPVAAILTSLFLAFDPTLLGHGALVTNDVAATLIFAAAGYLTWRVGAKWRWIDAAGLIVVCALGAGVKFTCIFLVPMVGLPLLIRAASSNAWQIGTRNVITRIRRIGVIIGLAISTALLAFLLLWPTYQFRSAPTPAGDHFDESYARRLYAYYTIEHRESLAHPDHPTDREAIKQMVPTFNPGIAMKSFYWLADHRLVPESLSFGLTYASGRSITRPSFMLGQYSDSGFLWYFPLAMVTKTPVVTLALLGIAAIFTFFTAGGWVRRSDARWKVICLTVPAMIYLTFAMLSNLNIGIRHILPIYPFMYVGAGVALSSIIGRYKPVQLLAGCAMLVLAIETTSAFPNYISFFNVASGGSRAALNTLGDSNLDWGQDLKAFADWQRDYHRANPSRNLYLACFGSVDPKVYGISAINATPGFPFSADPPVAIENMHNGVIAISATYLQGTLQPALRPWYDYLRRQEPFDVINDTIYVYRLPEQRQAKP